MTEPESTSARLPPRWFVRLAWSTHRGLYRVTGRRIGLRKAKPGSWGMMRLTTIGRRSGEKRPVMLGFIEDGTNLVTLAMNGWAEPEPAWWLNLQAHPEVEVETPTGQLRVRGRAAVSDERARLWAEWAKVDNNLDGYAARRPTETAVVVLEPIDPSSEE
ncbi:MAG: nitroreductase/quinone reductase family protein [Acidimicrobiia bacterium]